MEESGQLRGLRSKINSLRVPEIKVILVSMNLPRTGRKAELTDRIVDALQVLYKFYLVL
jgi:hypothetical protein